MILDLKICGISDSKTLKFIINHKYPVKFIGFIVNYPKSKRYVEFDKLRLLTSIDNKNSKFVAVLVKPDDEILEKIKNLNFDYYQIYDTSPDQIKYIKDKYKKKIIVAITVNNKNDVNEFLRKTAFNSKYREIVGFVNSTEIVSSDFYSSPFASVIDSQATIVFDNKITLYCWYDNEYGYSVQVVNLVKNIAGINLIRLPVKVWY